MSQKTIEFWAVDTLKYGDVHQKNQFLELPPSRYAICTPSPLFVASQMLSILYKKIKVPFFQMVTFVLTDFAPVFLLCKVFKVEFLKLGLTKFQVSSAVVS